MHHCIITSVTHCCRSPSTVLPPPLEHSCLFPWRTLGVQGLCRESPLSLGAQGSFCLTEGRPCSSFSFLPHIHFVFIKGLPSTPSRCPCCCPNPGLDQVSSGLLAPIGPGLSACPHQIIPPHGFFTVSPLTTLNNYLRLPQIDFQNKV